MFRSLIAFSLFHVIAALPVAAEAGGPNLDARSCKSDSEVVFTGGPIFGGRVAEDELGAPITGGPIFGGRVAEDELGAPITGGLIFGGRVPEDEIGAPITGGLIFGGKVHRSVYNSTPIVERPNRPFHFYGNSARRAARKTGIRGN